MKVFRNKITGRYGETQFGDDVNVLIKNAKAAGFKDAEIEIIDMNPDAYKSAMAQQNIADIAASPQGIQKEALRGKLKSQLGISDAEVKLIV